MRSTGADAGGASRLDAGDPWLEAPYAQPHSGSAAGAPLAAHDRPGPAESLHRVPRASGSGRVTMISREDVSSTIALGCALADRPLWTNLRHRHRAFGYDEDVAGQIGRA